MKNKMRKLLSLVTTIIMLFQLLPVSAIAGSVGTFNLPAGQEVEVTFVSEDGEGNSPSAKIKVAIDSNLVGVDLPKPAVPNGFVFVGWLDKNDLPLNLSDAITEPTTFKAAYVDAHDPDVAFMASNFKEKILHDADADHAEPYYVYEFYTDVAAGHEHTAECPTALYELICGTDDAHTANCYKAIDSGAQTLDAPAVTNFNLSQFAVKPGYGAFFTPKDGAQVPLTPGSTINIIDFNLPHKLSFKFLVERNVEAGKEYKYVVPQVLAGSNKTLPPVEIKDKASGIDIGTAQMVNNVLIVIFNEKAQVMSERPNPVIEFGYDREEELHQGSIPGTPDTPITEPIGEDGTEIIIIIERPDVLPKVTSKRVDWSRLTGKFTWTIKVSAPVPACEATIQDQFRDKPHKLLQETLNIRRVTGMDTEGNPITEDANDLKKLLDPTDNTDGSTKSFLLQLKEFSDELIITYDTIPWPEKTFFTGETANNPELSFKFGNRARMLKGDGSDTSDANATGGWQSAEKSLAVDMINKNAGTFNETNGTFTWNIELNREYAAAKEDYYYTKLPMGTKVVDKIPAGLVWNIPGDADGKTGGNSVITFNGFDAAGNHYNNVSIGNVAGTGDVAYYTLNTTSGEVEITFNKDIHAHKDSTFTITMDSDPDELVKQASVTNKAWIKYPGVSSGFSEDSDGSSFSNTFPSVHKDVTWQKDKGTFEWQIWVTMPTPARTIKLVDTFLNSFTNGKGQNHTINQTTLKMFDATNDPDHKKVGLVAISNPASMYESFDVTNRANGTTSGFEMLLKPVTDPDIKQILITYETTPEPESLYALDTWQDFANTVRPWPKTGTTAYGKAATATASLKNDRIDKVGGARDPITGFYSWTIHLIKNDGTNYLYSDLPYGTKVIDRLPLGLDWTAAGSNIALVGKDKDGNSFTTTSVSGTPNNDVPWYGYEVDGAGNRFLTITFPKGVSAGIGETGYVANLTITIPPNPAEIDEHGITTMTNYAKLVIDNNGNGTGEDNGGGVGVPKPNPGITKRAEWVESTGRVKWTITVTPATTPVAMTLIDEFRGSNDKTTYEPHLYYYGPDGTQVPTLTYKGPPASSAQDKLVPNSFVLTPSTDGKSTKSFKLDLEVFTEVIEITYETIPVGDFLSKPDSQVHLYNRAKLVSTTNNNFNYTDWAYADIILLIDRIEKHKPTVDETNLVYTWEVDLIKTGKHSENKNPYFNIDLPDTTRVYDYVPDGFVWLKEDGTLAAGAQIEITKGIAGDGSTSLVGVLSNVPISTGPYWQFEKATKPGDKDAAVIYFPTGVSAQFDAEFKISIPADKDAYYDLTSVSNTVELVVTTREGNLPDSSYTEDLADGLKIKKEYKAYNYEKNEATWLVTLNEAGRDLLNLKLLDTLNADKNGPTASNMRLKYIEILDSANNLNVIDKITVADAITTDTWDSVPVGKMWVNSDATQFSYNFGATDSKQVVRVVSEVLSSVIDYYADGKHGETINLSNRAESRINDNKMSKAVEAKKSLDVPVKKTSNGSITGLKFNEVAWKLVLQPINSPTSKNATTWIDEIPADMGTFSKAYDKGHWKINGSASYNTEAKFNSRLATLYGAGSYLKIADDGKSFELYLSNNGGSATNSAKLTLEYVTVVPKELYADNDNPKVTNAAYLQMETGSHGQWNGEGEGYGTIVKNVVKNVDPHPSEGTASWTVTINERQGMNIIDQGVGPIITFVDKLQQGLKVLDNTVLMSIDDGPWTIPADFEITGDPQAGGETLTINLQKTDIIGQKVVVAFDTLILASGKYENHVELKGVIKGTDDVPWTQLTAKDGAYALTPGYMQVAKVDENNTLVDGIQFAVYKKGDYTNPVLILTTGSEGKTGFTQVLTDATPGISIMFDYVIKELPTANNEFVLINEKYDNQPHSMLLPWQTLGKFTQVTNSRATAEFGLRKVAAPKNVAAVEGAKFQMTRVGTDSLGLPVVIILGFDGTKGDYTYKTNGSGAITALETDAKGEISVAGLPVGTYTLTETDAAPDFVDLDATNLPTWTVVVTADENGVAKVESITKDQNNTSCLGFKDNTLTVSNEPKQVYSDLEIFKLDEKNNKLVGAMFSLSATKFIQTDKFTVGTDFYQIEKTTSVDALTGDYIAAQFDMLVPGTYELKETVAPKGYYLLKDVWTVEIDATGDITVTDQNGKVLTAAVNLANAYEIVNKEIRSELKIFKVDDKDQPLVGATFTLTTEEIAGAAYGITYPATTTVNKLTNGAYVFTNIPQGRFTLTETVPAGYSKKADNWNVVVDKDGKVIFADAIGNKYDGVVDLTDGYKIFNYLNKGHLEIIKLDNNANPAKQLVGAEFTLSADDLVAANENEANYQNMKSTTAMNGANYVPASFKDLPQGTYTLTESIVPYGYEQTNLKWTVTVNADGSIALAGVAGTAVLVGTTIDLTNTYNVFNTQMTGDLHIYKLDSKNNELIDAGFMLTPDATTAAAIAVNGLPFDGSIRFTAKGVHAEFNKIPVGTYTLTEQVPAGFLKSADSWNVVVDKDGNTTIRDNMGNTLTNYMNLQDAYIIYNDPALTKLELIKRDEQGIALIGAEFTLTATTVTAYTNGTTFGDNPDALGCGSITLATDDQGYLSFTDIPAGTFVLKETKVPDGFQAIGGSDTWNVTVTVNNSEDVILDVVDARTGAKLPFALDVTDRYLINNHRNVASFAIFKTDEQGNALIGAEFTLAGTPKGTANLPDVNIVLTTTAQNNILRFNDIPEGEYTLTETKIPAGYEAINARTEWKIVVVDGLARIEGEAGVLIDLTEDYRIANREVLSRFALVKEDEAGNVLAGAEFSLAADSIVTGKAFATRTGTTGPDGRLAFNDLPEGTYTLTEVTPPYGYVLIDGKDTWSVAVAHNHDVTVEGNVKVTDGVLDITEDYQIQNRQLLNRITVRKVDDGTRAGLPGALFTLVRLNTTDRWTATSNALGYLAFENLPFGDYELTETLAPGGYLPTLQTWTFRIDGVTNQITFGNTVTNELQLTIGNTPAPLGAFTLTKVDSVTNAPLAGAVFTLTGGRPFVNLTGTTAADGTVRFENLTAGNYTLTETVAPYAYQITQATRTITVDLDGIVTMGGADLATTPLVITNTPVAPTGFGIRKIAANTGATLAGAVFSLRSVRTGEVLTATTDANGNARFDGLLPGTYVMTETAAPAGYARLTTTWTITVSDAGMLTATGLNDGIITVTNALTPPIPEVQPPNRARPALPPMDGALFNFPDMNMPLAGPGLPLTGFLSDNSWLWILLAISGSTILFHLAISMRAKKKKTGKG